jgi:cytochrome c553
MRVSQALALAVLGACTGSEGRRDLQEVENQARMAAHADVVDAIRLALVRGQLLEAQEAASKAKLEAPAGLSAENAAKHAKVVAGLQGLARAGSVGNAAALLGDVGVACGDCHRAEGVRPAAPPPPPIGADPASKMARHAWAADALWAGLIGAEVSPDPGAVLAESSLAPSGLPADSPWSPLATELALKAADVGARVQGASPGERGLRYGELLGTCATCHSLTGAGPAADWRPQQALDLVALSAAKTLGGKLKAEVVGSIGRDGPAATVPFCQQLAPQAAAQVEAQTGVRVGRSSLRLRNPANAAPDWVQVLLAEHGERPVAGVAPYTAVVDTPSGQVGRVALPIAVEGACLACHGAPDALAPGVREALAAGYPQDRATGYAAGDLRGLLWAETPPVR